MNFSLAWQLDEIEKELQSREARVAEFRELNAVAERELAKRDAELAKERQLVEELQGQLTATYSSDGQGDDYYEEYDDGEESDHDNGRNDVHERKGEETYTDVRWQSEASVESSHRNQIYRKNTSFFLYGCVFSVQLLQISA